MNLFIRRGYRTLFCATLLFGPAIAGAQTPADDESERPKPTVPGAATDTATARPDLEAVGPGLWPTEEMVTRGLETLTTRAADRFELDDAQSGKLKEMMLARWPKFLEDNKTEIQMVIGEVIAGRFRQGDPQPEQVKRLGGRVQPLFDNLRQNLEASAGDFRGLLNPEQREDFDAEWARVRKGLEVADLAVRDMREGVFAPDRWQQKAREAGLGPRDPNAASPGAEPSIPGQPSLSEWESYVAAFVRRHGLDTSQTTSAMAILDEISTRRSQYEQAVRDRIIDTQNVLRSAPDAETQELATKSLADFYAPIEEMWQELQTRLDGLLTPAQRNAAQAPSPGARTQTGQSRGASSNESAASDRS